MTTIAITGVGGLLGRRLVEALEGRADVGRIIGIDWELPEGLTASKLTPRRLDVRDPELTGAFEGVDVVVHLAFQHDPLHDEAHMRSINVDGTRAVLDAAQRAGVDHLVHTSSVLAYGARADNDVPLTEDSPLRGIPGFSYAEHTREVEEHLAAHLEADAAERGPTISVLRLGVLLGPGVDTVITRSFEAPRLPAVKGHRPPLQFLHPDDAVSAIVHALDHRLHGAYNVAAEGWLSFDEVAAIVGRGVVEVPEEVAYSTLARLWSLGIGEQPPGMLALFVHPWVVSSSKLIATGWRPHYTNRDAVASMAAEHAGYVSVLGVRTRWATLRRLAAGSAAVLALATWRLVATVRRRRAARAWAADEVADDGQLPR
ncbi:MAG: NAD-dependent epimerase/dehydratase family protein [Nitriliruptoraceae bacterium]